MVTENRTCRNSAALPDRMECTVPRGKYRTVKPRYTIREKSEAKSPRRRNVNGAPTRGGFGGMRTPGLTRANRGAPGHVFNARRKGVVQAHRLDSTEAEAVGQDRCD